MTQEPYEVRSQQVASPPPPPPPVYGASAPAVAPAQTAPATVSRTTVTPAGFRARQTIWVLLVIVDLILALRFIFYAAGAHDTGFAHAMFVLGAALDAPFRGIFNVTERSIGHPLQWADLLAIAIYSVAAWIVARLVTIAATPPARSGP